MSAPDSTAGHGRLLAGVTWAVLLLGLWLWGRGITDGSGASSAPTTGDIAAVGRPLGVPLPPPHDPIEGAVPKRVEIPSIGIEAPVVARGLDKDGAIEPPSFDTPQTVGWYGDGTEPGAKGPALLVGHVDTETRPAVFYGLSAARPGAKIDITRADGTVAEFTVDDVQVFTRARFDADKAYGPRKDGRAELRLITCGGTFDRKTHSYDANVVVSAYLTGDKPAGDRA
ncbi:class F sortase [Streptomyces sp. NBC_00053]|uniref:class F sortase n=1 Tax=unclassified Streptomyces TaxID=2593676 RepID=UPI000F5BBED2|nr:MULTISPECIES: class F sortase [unclassified Streptomyces]WSG51011.1 class F sortase [Streptomyces sp. NBC_01732]WSX01670.1 class F sortase [Streptomyces sp. NBC_00987]MCX4396442.1 class F sortase [Streptomyces sp. NBC_01767]MCX5100911.1 class F sortase [Streptomyces sp. NBC_00439]MCX5500674.1 class F sortase [Streptomyces sp. NBC_00052]